MRLEQFSVKKFRSIQKAEKLPLGDFTVLLGPNNEGKSNILQAMVMGMQELSGAAPPRRRIGSRLGRGTRRSTAAYNWDRDFPQALQAPEPDGKTTLRFDFVLTEEEVEELYVRLGSKINGKLPILLTYGHGRPQFRVLKQRASEALTALRDEIALFVAERVDIQYVEAVRTGSNVLDTVADMLDRELSAAANTNKEYAEALARLRAIQQPVFDALSASITERMQSLLPDVQRVEIVSAEGAVVRPTSLGGGMQVMVDDGNRTDLIYKGDGVQSLAALAMTQHYSAGRARAREFILAVEEPEAHLHPRAIHGLREALRDTAATQQVVITTHSPLFVNRLDLSSNIIVRKNQAKPATSVGELRDALGVRTADNLASAEMVLAVEGPTDQIALKAVLTDRSDCLRAALEGGVFAIYALHGGAKLNYMLTLLRDSLAVTHAFLDDDEAGQQAAQAAQHEGLLGLPDLTMATLSGAKKGSEFEDLVESSLYAEQFFDAFGVKLAPNWIDRLAKGKWSRRMEQIFGASGTPWNDEVSKQAKTIVATQVAADPGSAIKPIGSNVIDALVAALEAKLSARV